MRFKPWDIIENDGIDHSAIHEVSAYFAQQGGDLSALAEMLNRHIDDAQFHVNENILLGRGGPEGDPVFGPEFYLYLVSFTKQLIGRNGFRYGEGDDRELSEHHRIYERGMLLFEPWYVRPEEYENKGFSLLNVRIPLRYLRDRGVDPGELLEWFFSFMPESERRDESFFENDFFHLSDEACLLFHSLFEAFCNGRAALEDCFYRLYALPTMSVWGQIFRADSAKAFDAMISMRKTTISSFREDIKREHSRITWEIRLIGSYNEQTGPFRKSGVVIGFSSNMGANRAVLETTLGKRVCVRETRLFLDDLDASGGRYMFDIRYWYTRWIVLSSIGLLALVLTLLTGRSIVGTSGIPAYALVNWSVLCGIAVSAWITRLHIMRLTRENGALSDVCEHQHAAFENFSKRAGYYVTVGGDVSGQGPPALVSPLCDSPIDTEICALVRNGLSSKEIAARLCLSPRTVENRLHKLYKSMGVHSRTELLAKLHAYSPN